MSEHAGTPTGDEGVKGSQGIITFEVLERVVSLGDVQDAEPCLIFRIGSCVVLYILIFLDQTFIIACNTLDNLNQVLAVFRERIWGFLYQIIVH